ncbi:hypothetical protein [Planctomicrobium sp. SH527]|uniref:hypothetical protein n=1 Tax=Planctomicrobium sp. SH527 TaxID=3448123 RepID=UPI003F5C34E7
MKLSVLNWKLAVVMAAMTMATPLAVCSAEEPATVVLQAQDLKLNVPKTWKQQQVASRMRLAQYAIAPVEGELEPAELVVFPPMGGSVAENVKRWVDQFKGDGRSVKMTQGTSPQGKYVLVDLTGTYNKPDGPPIMQKTKPVDGYRMIAVMLQTEKGNYFLKLTGPEKSVGATVTDLRKSFGADETKEEPYSY